MNNAIAILEVVLASIRVATAGQNNDMIKKGLDLGETVLGTVKTGIAVDADIAERVTAYADEVEQLDRVNESDFVSAANDVRAALDRWNNAQ